MAALHDHGSLIIHALTEMQTGRLIDTLHGTVANLSPDDRGLGSPFALQSGM